MQGSDRLQVGALAALLVAGGALVWSVQLRQPLAVDASAFRTLPAEIASWRAQGDVPLETDVERMLRADWNLQRVYAHPLGERIALYLGYYGTERGGRPEHTPEVCYPSAGWGIAERRVVAIDPARGFRAQELVVERRGERALVLFWFRTYRSTGLLEGPDQLWDRLVGRLLDGRADGALVRLSTPLRNGDEVGARGRLVAFAAALDPLLRKGWPSEAPVSSLPEGRHP